MAQRRSVRSWLFLIFGLALINSIATPLALQLAIPPGFASAVWPPAGIALAACWYFGGRISPGVWLGSFFGNLVSVATSSPLQVGPGDLAVAVGIASGSTLAAVVAATWLRSRSSHSSALVTGSQLLGFFVIGAGLDPALAALCGASTLYLSGLIAADAMAFNWLTWAVGDSIGVLIFTPIALSLLSRERRLWRPRRRSVAVPLVISFVLVTGLFVFARARYGDRQERALDRAIDRVSMILSSRLEIHRDRLRWAQIVYAVGDSGDIDGDSSDGDDAATGARTDRLRAIARVYAEDCADCLGLAWRQGGSARSAFAMLVERAGGSVGQALEHSADMRAALASAAEQRALRATDAFALPGPEPERALWLVQPLCQRALLGAGRGCSEAGSSDAGALALALAPASLMARARTFARDNRLELWVSDDRATDGAQWLLRSVSSDGMALSPPSIPGHAADASASGDRRAPWRRRSLEVGGRTWTVHIAPTQAALTGRESAEQWGLLAGGMGFVGMLGLFLLGASGRRAEIESEVEQRTAELARVNRQLADEVSERKSAQEALAKSAAAAEAASEAKSRFLANMSHEIRTPMNAIIGMSELLAGGDLNAEDREYVAIIREASRSLLHIIEDVLDISRIEAGRIELAAAPFELAEVVESTRKLLLERALQRGLELRLEIASEVPATLIGDPGRLRQVLVNLVGNAIKFTEEGHVTVTVEVDPDGAKNPAEGDAGGDAGGDTGGDTGGDDDGRCSVRFCVSDTGVGVPADKQKLVFAAFEQADTSASRRYGGTGLGLTIASELVALMGGRIWMHSELGRGSQFYFTARFGMSAGAAEPR